MRLDSFLALKHKNFSRRLFQRFISMHGIQINSALIKKSHYLIKECDKILFPRKAFLDFIESQSKKEKSFAFDKNEVLFEDVGFLVVNKPPFTCVEDVTRGLFSVHRLDKDTSGALIIAKNLPVQARLQKEWQNKTVKKTYIALIKGILAPKKGAIEAAISRSERDRKKMSVSYSKKARSAFTGYKVIQYIKKPFGEFTLARVFPKTGRTHQIRVHFSAIGHPVIGDKVYGDKKLNALFEKKFSLKRQFLHAETLELTHPGTGKKIKFKSKLYPDLEKIILGIL